MLWEFLPLSCSQRARWLLPWARRRTVFGLAATRTDPYSPNPKTRLERLPSDRSKIGIGSEGGLMTATPKAMPQSSAADIDKIREKARRLGILSMMATTAAGSGHPTSCLSAAEL